VLCMCVVNVLCVSCASAMFVHTSVMCECLVNAVCYECVVSVFCLL